MNRLSSYFCGHERVVLGFSMQLHLFPCSLGISVVGFGGQRVKYIRMYSVYYAFRRKGMIYA
jgi:hypothetical protein